MRSQSYRLEAGSTASNREFRLVQRFKKPRAAYRKERKEHKKESGLPVLHFVFFVFFAAFGIFPTKEASAPALLFLQVSSGRSEVRRPLDVARQRALAKRRRVHKRQVS